MLKSCCPHLKFNSKIKHDVLNHIGHISVQTNQGCILKFLLIYLDELCFDRYVFVFLRHERNKSKMQDVFFQTLTPSLVSLTSLNSPFPIALLASLLPSYSRSLSTSASVFSWCQTTGCNC